MIEDGDAIYQFRGKYAFLSNFFRCPTPLIIDDGCGDYHAFITVEHAYQAWKTMDIDQRRWIECQPDAKSAKKVGRQITLRSDWTDICLTVMEQFVRMKFAHHDLIRALIDTYPKTLYEGNHWGDRFWGVDMTTLEGHNHLGRLLMQIRQPYIHHH